MPQPDINLTAHLLRRAGFGPTAVELDEYTTLGYEGAVERLLNPQATDDSALDRLLASAARLLDADDKILDGAALWLLRMIYGRRPLQEKMALFWHNHFATGAAKVNQPPWMYDQARLFREKGLARFDDLLLGVAHDPAMLIWLDNHANRKDHLNENWGRELIELFTIGHGNYSEADVPEVARSFTGWTAPRAQGFTFRPTLHDYGSKTVLGKTGNFDGGDIVTMLAGMRQSGVLLARKMWRWFVNDTVDEAGVQRLADVYFQSNHNITAVLRSLFLSSEFRSPANFFATVKNPPEFIAGAIRGSGAAASLQGSLDAAVLRRLAQFSSQMGMTLYNPPNVGGWQIGKSWIVADTYLLRTTFAQYLAGSDWLQAQNLAPQATDATTTINALLTRLFTGPMPDALRAPLLKYAASAQGPLAPGLLRLILSSPSYQLN